jgi:hypothetical protein
MGDAQLEQFCILAKSAKGRAAVHIIAEATSAPNLFAFGELLDQPNLQEVTSFAVDDLRFAVFTVFHGLREHLPRRCYALRYLWLLRRCFALCGCVDPGVRVSWSRGLWVRVCGCLDPGVCCECCLLPVRAYVVTVSVWCRYGVDKVHSLWCYLPPCFASVRAYNFVFPSQTLLTYVRCYCPTLQVCVRAISFSLPKPSLHTYGVTFLLCKCACIQFRSPFPNPPHIFGVAQFIVTFVYNPRVLYRGMM